MNLYCSVDNGDITSFTQMFLLKTIPTAIVNIWRRWWEYMTIFVLSLSTKVLEPNPQKCACVPVASFHHIRQQWDTWRQYDSWMDCKCFLSMPALVELLRKPKMYCCTCCDIKYRYVSFLILYTDLNGRPAILCDLGTTDQSPEL